MRQFGLQISKLWNLSRLSSKPLPFFLLVVTCVENDMQDKCSGHVTNSRIPGLNFDAVCYAEDTIPFSTSAR